MGNGCRKKVRNVKIKKVDDKPMVIHTKQKATIHTKNAKETKIKGSNVYTVERGPKISKAEVSASLISFGLRITSSGGMGDRLSADNSFFSSAESNKSNGVLPSRLSRMTLLI